MNKDMKIYIVDDDKFYCSLVKDYLSSKGYSDIQIFHDGLSMLPHADKPDVIILDYEMDDENGLDILKVVKKSNFDVHVIFLSNQTDVKIAVNSLKFGSVDYIRKSADAFHKLEVLIGQLSPRKKSVIKRLNGRMKAIIPLSKLLLYFSVMFLISSCSVQNLFQSEVDYNTYTADSLLLAQQAYRIKTDDKISVSIWDHDDMSVGSIFGIYNSNEVYGKWILVNNEGEIDLPSIGAVKLEGLTTKEAAKKLSEIYSKVIKDPVIVVKVLNKEITVLGEVNDPGRYLLEKEENYLVDVIGMAGGFDIYAKKTEIKLIRGNTLNPEEYLIDLTQMDDYTFSNLPVFPGDIIYVPSRKAKMVDKRSTTLIPYATAISAIAIILTLIK